MNYKNIEKPDINESYDFIEEGLRKRATISLYTYCKVEYEGRALSQLNYGERLIIIKPDGSFLIHQNKKVEPVNWQPPKSRTKVYIKNNKLFLESNRRTPRERLEVEINNIETGTYAILEDYEELEQAGYEKDMGDMIMKNPHIIEEGFKPTAREYSVNSGFIDILGKDKDGNLMILELKSRKIGVSAVKQIRRYVEDLKNTENREFKTSDDKKKIRGILVAPKIDNDAKEMIEEENFEFVECEPPKELKKDKKVTLDIFK
ncbi:MAG: endonuclease NucS [Methanobrevibacter sp.]